MKIFYPTILTAFILTSLGLNAEEYSNWQSEQCLPCVADDCCERGYYFAGADWLHWKTEQGKMEFAALVNQVVTPGLVDVDSTIIRPKFEMDNGYRIFAGYETCDKNWVFTVTYTHMPSKALATETENPSFANDSITIFNTNFPLLSALISTPLDTITGVWDVTTNYLDIDVARNYAVCDRLQLRPHLGARAIWCDQDFSVSGAGSGVSFTSTMKENLNGIGMEGGLWGTYDCGCGFALVGHFGGGVLYADFDNKGTLLADEGGGTILDIRYKDKIHQSLAMGDALIGVRYSTCLWNMLINLHVGWEQHIILDTNQFSVNGGGNMTMQGLTLGGSIAY